MNHLKGICNGLMILVFTTIGFAQKQHAMDKAAVHGMLLFGESQIYASHLPMFHSPHQYQVILELELESSLLKVFKADQKLNHGQATYTIEPEKFILPEMIKSPKAFKVNLYRGHFERGGVKLASEKIITIKNVIYFKPFELENPRMTQSQYLVFGNSKEQFMVHIISNRPDFDHLVKISTVSNGSFSDTLVLNRVENQLTDIGGNTISVPNLKNETRSISILRQLYLEFSDLK